MMTPEEFRSLGPSIVDWIADYQTNGYSGPVSPNLQPGRSLRGGVKVLCGGLKKLSRALFISP
jgi:hypothetical protein